MNNTEKAKSLLREGAYTCVLVNGEEIFSSQKRGVAPLLEFIESGKSFAGFSAADKIVGKAAALLYAHMGVQSIFAEVASETAVEICKKYGVSLEYGVLTDKIINRKGDGICPMEQAVSEIFTPREAFVAIKQRLSELNF